MQAFAKALEVDDDAETGGAISPPWPPKPSHERTRKISAISDFAPVRVSNISHFYTIFSLTWSKLRSIHEFEGEGPDNKLHPFSRTARDSFHIPRDTEGNVV